jgi:hypothetical protein
LRDGVNDAPVEVRSPLIAERAIAGQIGAGEVTQHRLRAPQEPDAVYRFKVGEVYSVAHMEVHRHSGYRRARQTFRPASAVICRISFFCAGGAEFADIAVRH